MCDRLIYEQEQVRDILNDMLFACHSWLSKGEDGEWEMYVDGTGSSVATFGENDGYWDNCEVISCGVTPADSAIKTGYVNYDSGRYQISLVCNTNYGIDQTYEPKCISERVTAEKLLSYIYGRATYADKKITLKCGVDADEVTVGQVITVTADERDISSVTYRVIRTARKLLEYTLDCEVYNASIFSDQVITDPTAQTGTYSTRAINTIDFGTVGGAAISPTDITVPTGGDIILTSSDTDPALLRWSEAHNMGAAETLNNGLCLWPSIANQEYFFIGWNPVSPAGYQRYKWITLAAQTDLDLRTWYDSTHSASIQIDTDDDESNITLRCNAGAGEKTFRFNNNNTGDLTVPCLHVGGEADPGDNNLIVDGAVYVGIDDDTSGTLYLYGGGATEEGGEIQLFMAADHDTTYEHWRIDVATDSLRFGPTGQTYLEISANGSVGIRVAADDDHMLKVSGSETSYAVEFTNTHADGDGLNINAGSDSGEYIIAGRDKDATLRFKVMADGTGGSDSTWAEFSPTIGITDPTPDDYLDWALLDAKKPHKPYVGMWSNDIDATNEEAKSYGVISAEDELEKYGKSSTKIGMGVAIWAETARDKINQLEQRLTALEGG
jgi:hypothetical protein